VGYEASEPCGGPVHALVFVWELKKGSGGEGEFNPRAERWPCPGGRGTPSATEKSHGRFIPPGRNSSQQQPSR